MKEGLERGRDREGIYKKIAYNTYFKRLRTSTISIVPVHLSVY